MNTDYQILQQALLTGEQVESLRVAVGWDRMAGKYEEILRRSFMHFSVQDDTQLIGFVNVISDGVGDAYLVDLMVHPDHRHQGLGHALVTRAIQELTRKGIRCIQVVFEPSLEPFYASLGFYMLKAGIIDNHT